LRLLRGIERDAAAGEGHAAADIQGCRGLGIDARARHGKTGVARHTDQRAVAAYSYIAPAALLPVLSISAPASSVILPVAARMISEPVSGSPELSTVICFAVTSTAESSPPPRTPPMRRLPDVQVIEAGDGQDQPTSGAAGVVRRGR